MATDKISMASSGKSLHEGDREIDRRLKKTPPYLGIEPRIFGLGDRRLIHWASRALLASIDPRTVDRPPTCCKLPLARLALN